LAAIARAVAALPPRQRETIIFGRATRAVIAGTQVKLRDQQSGSLRDTVANSDGDKLRQH
jgi:hypothetical protein